MSSEFLSSNGDKVVVGEAIASGGEGTIHPVIGNPSLLAKIYDGGRTPDPSTREKLQVMISLATDELRRVAAWPSAILFDSREGSSSNTPVKGLLMPKAPGTHHVYELYNPSYRLASNSGLRYSHLVAVAANVATAFAVVHQHGHVVADGNQGNILVSKNGAVMLIDCDSYQIVHRGQVYACPVGVPEYTAPELHGASFGAVTRTVAHDAFALAVIIFQLLFGGRHPFAGTPVGGADFGDIAENIRSHRYAYASDAVKRGLVPPAAAVPVSTVPTQVRLLFERAFTTDDARPRPDEWLTALQAILDGLACCDRNTGHDYANHLDSCPWCRMETQGTFLFVGQVKRDAEFPIDDFERRFREVTAGWERSMREYEAETQLLNVPEITPQETPYRTYHPDYWRVVYAHDASIIGAIVGLVLGVVFVPMGFLARVLVSLVIAGGSALFSHLATMGLSRLVARIVRRRYPHLGHYRDVEELNLLVKEHNAELSDGDDPQGTEFPQLLTAIARDIASYRRIDAELAAELRDLDGREWKINADAYLRTVLIRNATIDGIARDGLAALAAHGIETAADISEDAVLAVPGFGAKRTARLISWRAGVIQRMGAQPPKRSALAAERAQIEHRYAARRGVIAASLRRADTVVAQRADRAARELHDRHASHRQRAALLRERRADLIELMIPPGRRR